MARKLRVEYEGAIYHVVARGVEQRVIFDDDKDREHFLKRLGEGVEEYGVRLYLYCLMTNHFHLVLETPSGNLSAFMHKIQTAHTVYYNLRHQRVGHLLQGRFKSPLVDGDEYLDRLSRYLHLNPVYIETNRKKPLEERIRLLRSYKWSSYLGYAGICEHLDCVDEAPLLAIAGGVNEKARRRNYRRFVESGVAKSDEEFVEVLKNSKWGIGDEEFQARIRDIHTDLAGKVRRPEDVALRRVALDVKPDLVIKTVAEAFGVEAETLKVRSYGSRVRAVAARMLMRYSGLNQRDAGMLLNIGSGAGVCQQLKCLRECEETDKALAAKIEKISAKLLRSERQRQ